jgi:transcriptional regulator with XRE-family HTH domain
MGEDWSAIVSRYRLRHSFTQKQLGQILGVSQRTVSRWERGQDRPSLTLQKHLRDLSWDENGTPASWLLSSVKSCPAPRALSRLPNLVLLALSKPAIRKRPSMVDWIGRDLTRIASGVLAEMLDDRVLQRSIASGEIACVEATTRSVLRSAESETIGAFSTTITYFFHEDVLYSDALSVPADPGAALGYRAVPMDEFVSL